MRPEDLMIGDWVRCPGLPQYGEFFQVADITPCICIDAERELFANPEDLEPIPLTPEILEKNGFIVKHPESEKRTYLKDRAGQIVVHKNRGLLFFNISGNPWKFGWFHPAFSGHIRFVHELQHALCLCGIEKEIEL